jgi:hypothetical protein
MVFADPLEMTMADERHSESEARFASMELSERGRVGDRYLRRTK